MDRIFMENFRCFRKSQSARLAPLTLLVGENSTGKTSFLALVRALWRVAFQDQVPDFREEPYDLGTFADVVHNRGGRSKQAESFRAGFEYRADFPIDWSDKFAFKVSFDKKGAFPFPRKRRLESAGVWIDIEIESNGKCLVGFGTPDFSTGSSAFSFFAGEANSLDNANLFSPRYVMWGIRQANARARTESSDAGVADNQLNDRSVAALSDEDLQRLDDLCDGLPVVASIAGAPIRSRPRRTYDPTRPRRDPEGEYIPTYLASMSFGESARWKILKDSLEGFGRESGLFDEISIKSFGDSEGSPFQVHVRKFGGRVKGPWRNLIDVGYGVNQALPLLTELLNPEPFPISLLFLLQQPEVHLHPSAQAALGSLFCSVAGPERQLIVETHSDYLLDRVRMDVRDKKTGLKPEDVSILYFERDGLEVNIHSLRLDEMGNVLDAPPGYGQFFMDEVTRSIGF